MATANTHYVMARSYCKATITASTTTNDYTDGASKAIAGTNCTSKAIASTAYCTASKGNGTDSGTTTRRKTKDSTTTYDIYSTA